MSEDEMKEEYDFSKGERGKFYRPNSHFHIPVYLDEVVMGRLTDIADQKGVPINDLVNEMLKRDLAMLEPLR